MVSSGTSVQFFRCCFWNHGCFPAKQHRFRSLHIHALGDRKHGLLFVVASEIEDV